MPSQLVFDPWMFGLICMCLLLLGALCAYISGKVWDDPHTGVSHQAFIAHAQPCRTAIDDHAARIAAIEERLGTFNHADFFGEFNGRLKCLEALDAYKTFVTRTEFDLYCNRTHGHIETNELQIGEQVFQLERRLFAKGEHVDRLELRIAALEKAKRKRS